MNKREFNTLIKTFREVTNIAEQYHEILNVNTLYNNSVPIEDIKEMLGEEQNNFCEMSIGVERFFELTSTFSDILSVAPVMSQSNYHVILCDISLKQFDNFFSYRSFRKRNFTFNTKLENDGNVDLDNYNEIRDILCNRRGVLMIAENPVGEYAIKKPIMFFKEL